MRTIQGVSVSAGIAIGTVRVLAAVDYAVERRLIDDPQAEMDRFRAARDTAVAQLKQLRDNVAAEFGENKAELFDAHRLMLQDPDYAECVEGLIAQDKVNAEFAVKSAAEQFAAMFAAMDSSTMQARAADVKDVSRRVMNVLQGKRDSTAQDGSVQGDAVQNGIVQNGIAQNGESHIIFAEDLAPSDTAQLDRAKVLGLVTAKGSANSHTAILARTMGLPAITGIGDAFDPADDGHVAVIDGTSGAVFVDPDEATLTEYRRRKAEAEEHLSLLRKLKGKPTETKSGQRVHLYANISRPSDAAAVLANGGKEIAAEGAVAAPRISGIGGCMLYLVDDARSDLYADFVPLPGVDQHPAGFGLTFEVPVVEMLLVKLGMVTQQQLRDARRYVFVGAFIVAAVLTPPDVLSQFMLAIPLILLYELGIYLAGFIAARSRSPADEGDASADRAATPATPPTKAD